MGILTRINQTLRLLRLVIPRHSERSLAGPRCASAALYTQLTEMPSYRLALHSELTMSTGLFCLSSPPLARWCLIVARSAAVPTLIRDWVAKYHKQAEENGVAVGDTTKLESGMRQLTNFINS